jgi:hypothetical protein
MAPLAQRALAGEHASHHAVPRQIVTILRSFPGSSGVERRVRRDGTIVRRVAFFSHRSSSEKLPLAQPQ